MTRSPIYAFLGLAALTGTAFGQFNDQWVTFSNVPSMLSSGTISDFDTETDLGWGDLDNDGFVDVVVVRKEPFTSTGKRTNILLMNVNGVLTDKTAQFATDSDVGGDQGFQTATNDRDVAITDVDRDGWLDAVTATTISDGNPKHISHPRVYRNKKATGGNWQGLRFENGRIPQLLHFGNGQPKAPRFCSVAAGDVTGDEYPDLFFGDYDSSGAGGSGEPSSNDLNDRLLINDGNGFFSDQSQARMTSDMLQSAFAAAAVIADMNGDGANDVLKQTALTPPQDIRVIYNRPGANEGTFNINDKFHLGFTPYHVNAGDLNKDGRLDIVSSEDEEDLFRINQGNDGLGRVIWSGAKFYSFVSGGDDGFGSNNLVADLDGDGWNDTLHCDVDVDIGGFNRRLHIYHNRGGAVGGTPVLREEREKSGAGGWYGVVGMKDPDLEGTHDVAVFDIDNDCDLDMLVSRAAGTFVWRNDSGAGCPVTCQTDLGFQSGTMTLQVCGGDLSAGQPATMTIANAPPSSSGIMFVGLASNPTFVFDIGGTLVPVPFTLVVPLPTGSGTLNLPVPAGFGPLTLYTQFVAAAGAGSYQISNAVKIDYP